MYICIYNKHVQEKASAVTQSHLVDLCIADSQHVTLFVCLIAHETTPDHKTEDRHECECVLHTSKESSRFQTAVIPSLASTVILDVVPLTVTPNETIGRDTLQQNREFNET